jgi:hypothetical protein
MRATCSASAALLEQAERDVRLERLAPVHGLSASCSSISSAAPSDGSA